MIKLFYELSNEVDGANFQSRGSPKWRLVPTRREQEKWDRAAKAATGGSVSDSYKSFL